MISVEPVNCPGGLRWPQQVIGQRYGRMSATSLEKIKSAIPRYMDTIITRATTARAVLNVSLRVGQVTFFSSPLTSSRYSLVCSYLDCSFPCGSVASFFFFLVIRHHSISCGRPGGIRTPSPRIWSPMLCQFELLACIILNYLLSLCGRCLPQNGQNFFSSSLEVVFFLFLQVA